MRTNETVVNIFKTDAELKDGMLEFLKNNIDDFGACENEFDISVTNLRNSLAEENAKQLNELITWMYKKVIAEMKYEFILGMKANYEYFNAPSANDFLESDIGIFTKEKNLFALPASAEAQRNIIKINESLAIEDGEFYDGIREYFIYLDTVCPKLMHYYGYITGNRLFAEIIPGYVPSIENTHRYTSVLEEYFGCDLSNITDCAVVGNGEE